MEFRKEDREMNFIDSQFATEPCINVVDKYRFNDRVQKVFELLYQALSKSFGPGGAGTFISFYPKYYNTKDGFTIMKNIAFDKKIDQLICDMVMDICSRLNYTVGDGTTTAVIATKSIYESYMNRKDFFDNTQLLPRDIISRLDRIKDIILEEIDKQAKPIRSTNPDILEANIRNVVWISSNGNQEITDMISGIYRELMYPAISCTLAKDGLMKAKIVSGYNIDASILDKMYINNDDNTMVLNGANVVIFDHKITKDTYQHILVPLSVQSKNRGKHLVCVAPYYDDVALNGVIRSDLTSEYRKNGDVNLVLTACKKSRGIDKIKMDDLAMLLNTTMITSQMELDIISAKESGKDFYEIFNMDNRDIEGLHVAYAIDSEHLRLSAYHKDVENKPYGYEFKDTTLRIGYCDELTLGLKDSTFSGFYYNETEYEKYLNVANSELEEVRKKVESVGSLSFDLIEKQDRVYSLRLKRGIIEVGATSEISQTYLKDMVDDAVKAAQSAYNNGVVLGCNVTLSNILAKMMVDTSLDEIDRTLVSIIFAGFCDVYNTILKNVFDDIDLTQYVPEEKIVSQRSWSKIIVEKYLDILHEKTPCKNIEFNEHDMDVVYPTPKSIPTVHGLLMSLSIINNVVVDLGNGGSFSTNIINSAETDKEILKATIDLLSLLITGNQLVIR